MWLRNLHCLMWLVVGSDVGMGQTGRATPRSNFEIDDPQCDVTEYREWGFSTRRDTVLSFSSPHSKSWTRPDCANSNTSNPGTSRGKTTHDAYRFRCERRPFWRLWSQGELSFLMLAIRSSVRMAPLRKLLIEGRQCLLCDGCHCVPGI